ncbi:claudin-16-like [Ascaphus truei]|uniref:claudin-16-like n=1 Tax=Ascaphus truei TaxID=8439 RepID=UPI003F59E193
MANIWTCDIPVSYLSGHPVALVITRALVIVKGALSIAAAPLLIMGMKCTTFINSRDHHKVKLSTAAGTMFLIGGVCGGIAVLWYAIDTALKYRTEVGLGVPGITYELGYSYWFAAASAICACVPALLLLGLNCRSKAGAEKKPSNTFQPRIHNSAITYL